MADWQGQAACYLLPGAGDIFFPDLDDGDNHGAQAKAICAQCAVARDCLEAAIDRGEDHGIWGGAGGDLMRWLRRMHARGPAAWETAVGQHLAQLRGETSAVVNRNGPGAKHGRRVTYNRGCRCGPCCRSVNDDRTTITAGNRYAPAGALIAIPTLTIELDRSDVA